MEQQTKGKTMRIGFDSWIWVVLNPTKDSMLTDILFRVDLNGLQDYLIGSALRSKERPSDREMAIWTDVHEATLDAEERMTRRAS